MASMPVVLAAVDGSKQSMRALAYLSSILSLIFRWSSWEDSPRPAKCSWPWTDRGVSARDWTR